MRLKSNPLNDSDKNENIRQLMLARVSGLKMFNRTPVDGPGCKGKLIGGQERKGAEIDYLKKFGKEWLETLEKKELAKEFHRQHPRYQKLIECTSRLFKFRADFWLKLIFLSVWSA